MKAARGMAAQ
jgi:hypothetical protein